MNPSSWEKSRNKRRPLWILLTVAGVAIIVGIFIQNNSDLFWETSTKVEEDTEYSDTEEDSESLEFSHDSIREAIASKVGKPSSGQGQPDMRTESSPERTVELNNVKCKIADRPGLAVIISIKLVYNNSQVEDEILFKREDLRVMIYKALADKKLSEILVEKIRPEIIREVNSVLKKGKITDVIFTDFRIEKVFD
ncbi:MAG: hypothetical protein GF401_18005 [Chitinivibrionales bacterium]|nr:hypothetical protein [Chitinivibrionales bacterium]